MLHTNHPSMVTTVEPKATLSTFLTSDQRHNSLHQDQICHRCPALKLFGLSSNHTHFILEAFVTTSLFMWILPVETVRPVKTQTYSWKEFGGFLKMLMRIFCNFKFYLICAWFALFEETSDLYSESSFLPGKERKIDEKLGMIKKKKKNKQSKLCDAKSEWDKSKQILRINYIVDFVSCDLTWYHNIDSSKVLCCFFCFFLIY